MSDAVLTHPPDTVPPQAPAGAVATDALAAIADAHAFELWGDDFARGDPRPVLDATGAVRAYVFPYALGTRVFPTDLASISRDPANASRFAAIYVAASRTAHPVLRVVHGVHPMFLQRDEALMIGRSALRTRNVQVSQVYWLGLHEEFFELRAGSERVLLDVWTLKQADAEKVLSAPRPGVLDVIEPERFEPLAAARPVLPEHGGRRQASLLQLVPLADCVPAVDWTWWCVPTAWTMATCYYDNFVKNVGGATGYGRLVGYWLEDPKSAHNVPDFLNQLVDPATGDWRTGFNGFADFVQKTYGYTFTTRYVAAAPENDWAWSDITAEIDAGRPFVWGVPNHATCALGYRVTSTGKYVVIHTTWGDTQQAQRQEWLYTQGTGLTAITPGGGTAGQDLALWTLDGDDVLLTNIVTTLKWYVWGGRIKTAEIAVSTDGGNSWTNVASTAPCVPGWNEYAWTPLWPSDRTRIRLRGHDANGVYIAGDGSQRNVRVLPGPRPVTLKTILVKTKTDGTGFFSAPHGLERFSPDGYTIHAICANVQHKNGNWHNLELSHDVDNRFWWNKDIVAGVINSPNFFDQPVEIVIFAEAVVG